MDVGSVVAAYAIVVFAIVLYVASIGRRTHVAIRTADALRRERERDERAIAPAAPPSSSATTSERPR